MKVEYFVKIECKIDRTVSDIKKELLLKSTKKESSLSQYTHKIEDDKADDFLYWGELGEDEIMCMVYSTNNYYTFRKYGNTTMLFFEGTHETFYKEPILPKVNVLA